MGDGLSDDACLFCKIIAGTEPSETVASNGLAVAFRDKFPRAPVHVLVATREHVDTFHALQDDDLETLAAIAQLARQVAETEGIANAYRLATNIGTGGGQAIPHLHFHVLGGRQLLHIDSGEPPKSQGV